METNDLNTIFVGKNTVEDQYCNRQNYYCHSQEHGYSTCRTSCLNLKIIKNL